jgi:hypothetical protein
MSTDTGATDAVLQQILLQLNALQVSQQTLQAKVSTIDNAAIVHGPMLTTLYVRSMPCPFPRHLPWFRLASYRCQAQRRGCLHLLQ